LTRIKAVFLYAFIILLTVGDIVTTEMIVNSSIGEESNLLVLKLMNAFGRLWWLPKLLLAMLLGWMALSLWKRRAAKVLVGAYCGFYFFLISYHLALLQMVSEVERLCK